MIRRNSLLLLAALAPMFLAVVLMSCASNNPSAFRVLTNITVTPASADAKDSNNGQVQFTATGTFSLPPTPAPVSFAAPYAGQFIVDNPVTGPVANVVASGTGTVTVQCVSGASGTVSVTASAAANNGTNTVVSASGQLTCP